MCYGPVRPIRMDQNFTHVFLKTISQWFNSANSNSWYVGSYIIMLLGASVMPKFKSIWIPHNQLRHVILTTLTTIYLTWAVQVLAKYTA